MLMSKRVTEDLITKFPGDRLPKFQLRRYFKHSADQISREFT
jgi:hypothetical protein